MSATTRNIESESVNSSHGSEESTWTLATSETQPLLVDAEGQAHARKRTPLPVRGLAALCAVRLVDPIVFTQIFPYVNEMIDGLHLTDDPSRLGFYSGLVESTFAISQLFSIYSWARLSDTIGRRPVIIMGILGVAVTTLFLGLSRSLQGILIARFLAGLAAGNVAVIHSVLGELTDSTNSDIAFPIYGLTWPVGAIIGPLIGGTFSRPAEKYSWLNCMLFRAYPYLLPGIISAGIATLGAVAGMLFLDETLPSKRRKANHENQSHGSVDDLKPIVQVAEPPSMRELLALPVIRSLTLSGSALAFVQTSYDVIFVLFAYTPIGIGGLAFTSREIGYVLSMQGVLAIGIQIIILPSLLRRVRPETIYSICMWMWPFAFVVVPFLNVIARAGLNVDNGRVEGSWAAALWACLAFQTLLTRIACIAYSVNMILLRDHAPGASALGTTNGLAQLFMSLARAFAPAAASSAFALSIDNSLLGGQMWVVAMVGVSALGILATSRIARTVTEKEKHGAEDGKLDRLRD